MGQSLGGHTAMLTAAAAHPHLVRRLVLIKAGPGGPNPNVQAEIGGWLDAWAHTVPVTGGCRRIPRRRCGRRGMGRRVGGARRLVAPLRRSVVELAGEPAPRAAQALTSSTISGVGHHHAGGRFPVGQRVQ
ncbi:hypothetical protein ACFT8P_34630 [Streptomyces sp. NPDC057101]|uniref:hypothetical protein n=1 Tax=Streptomyces sp. NPDC057101 TaxID=3346020 RepID=UPI00362CA9EA